MFRATRPVGLAVPGATRHPMVAREALRRMARIPRELPAPTAQPPRSLASPSTSEVAVEAVPIRMTARLGVPWPEDRVVAAPVRRDRAPRRQRPPRLVRRTRAVAVAALGRMRTAHPRADRADGVDRALSSFATTPRLARSASRSNRAPTGCGRAGPRCRRSRSWTAVDQLSRCPESRSPLRSTRRPDRPRCRMPPR